MAWNGSYTTAVASNESANESLHTLPTTVKTIFLGLVLGCIILATICGNVLVLLAVYVNTHLRSTTNYFIVNLAIADLLLGITVLPFSATLETLNYWPFGFAMCDIWASADVLWCTASIMTLCVISIDRYIGVTRPLQHSSIITERRAFIIIICVWVLSIIISIAPLVGWKETEGQDSTECTVTKQIGYVIFSVSGSFYIPLLIIIIVYIRIYKEATRHTKFLNSGIKTTKIDEKNGVVLRIHKGRTSNAQIATYQSSSSSDHSEGSGRKLSSRLSLAGKMAKFKKEKKAAKTLGIVVGVFIICWFPFFFCLPLDVLCSSCHVPQELFTVIFWLGYCNSLMNPVIYASSSREFKRAFLRVIRCQFKRNPRLFLNTDCTSAEFHKWRNSVNEMRKSSSDYKPRVSFTGSQQSENDDLMQINETTFSVNRRNSESPMASLRVLPNHRRSFSRNVSSQLGEQRSSISDLADDEQSDMSSYHSESTVKQAVIKVPSNSKISSFTKDENYIDAFKNNRSQTVL